MRLKKKDTEAKKAVLELLLLFGKNEDLNLIQNVAAEPLLMNLASICTQELRAANEDVKEEVTKHFRSLE